MAVAGFNTDMGKKEMELVKQPESEGKRTMTNLKMKDNFRLINFIVEQYASSGMNDEEFAVKAAEELSLPEINVGHIRHRRGEFDIPSNTKVKTEDANVQVLAAQVLAQAKQIADLQERMAQVEGWINTTFPSKGPKAAIA